MANVTFNVVANQATFESKRDNSKNLSVGGLYFITDSQKLYRATAGDTAVDFTEAYKVVDTFPAAASARIGCLYINSSTHEVKVKSSVNATSLTTVIPPLNQVYVYKGSCLYSELPGSGNTVGDVWNVTDAHGSVPAGTNYAWNGTGWDALGGSIDLSNYLTTSSSINDLSDVNVGTPANENVLMYNSTSGKWEATTIPSGVTTLAGLSDTNVTGADTTTNKFLVYSGTTGNEKWTATSVDLGTLNDVTITSPSAGQVIKRSGNSWVNSTFALTDLSDATISSSATNQVLAYDGSKWTNTSLPLNAGNVTLTTPTSGDVLYYNGSGWVNTPANSTITWIEVNS